MTDKQALILAAAIVMAGFFSGGLYISSSSQYGVFITNRLTGATYNCGADGNC